MTLKEKLGWGIFNREDEVMGHELARTARPRGRFDSAMASILTNMLMQLVVPWINFCFAKYSEPEFHSIMATDFDFIADWKLNHKERFTKFVKTARVLRNRFDYNELDIYDEIIKIFERRGFQLTEKEKLRMMETVLTLKDIIYLDTEV
jgi:hypothetical protein